MQNKPKIKNLNSVIRGNNSILLKKNYIICFFITILIFVFDRISKIKIINSEINNDTFYINDFINFDLVWNTGIGFGLLSFNSSLIYNSITSIIGIVIIIIGYFIIKSKLREKIFLAIILGGALGNFYDRLIYYAVPDFIDFHYDKFHWFTFNIADIFITIGIFGLIITDVTKKNEKN